MYCIVVYLEDTAAPHCLLRLDLLFPKELLLFSQLFCAAEHKLLCTLPPPRVKRENKALHKIDYHYQRRQTGKGDV